MLILLLLPCYLSLRPTAPKGHTYLTVLVGQVKHLLWQIGRLDNAANLDSTLLFDKFSYRIKQFG